MAVYSIPLGVNVGLVNGATGTGTTSSVQFTVQPKPSGGYCSLILQAIPTGVFTSLLADILISTDGGNTFNKWQRGLDLLQNPTYAINQPLYPGPIFQISITKFTGGTSAVVNGCVN